MKEITIITAQGVKNICIGDKYFPSNEVITEIKKHALYFNGDPIDHYCGFNIDGKMIFSINCICPCEVRYI